MVTFLEIYFLDGKCCDLARQPQDRIGPVKHSTTLIQSDLTRKIEIFSKNKYLISKNLLNAWCCC